MNKSSRLRLLGGFQRGLLLPASILLVSSASGAEYQFVGGNGGGNNIRWGTSGAWNAYPGPGSGAVPTSADIAYFVNNTANAAITDVAASQSAGGIVLNRATAPTLNLTASLTVTTSGGHAGTTTLQQSALIQGTGAFSTVNFVLGGGTLTMNGSGARSVTSNSLVTASSNLAGDSAVSLTNLHVNSATTLGISGTGTKTISGRLSGSGAITGALSLSGSAVHSVGGSLPSVTGTYSSGIGSQTVGTVNYAASSVFSWDLASASLGTRGTNYDAVTATSITAASGAIFRIVLGTTFNSAASFWQGTQTWDVFQFTGINSGTFASFQLYDTSGLVNYASAGSFSFNSSTGDLTWTAVPEPASALAGVLLGAGLLRRRRVMTA